MQRTFIVLSFFCILVFALGQEQTYPDREKERKAFLAAESRFQEAERLFNHAGDNELLLEKADTTYTEALKLFTDLVSGTTISGNDSITLLAGLRAGLISYYQDRPQDARQFYLQAFRVRPRVPQVPDSLLFIPYIYTGGIYYNSNSHDSALHFYNLAKEIQEKYREPLPESERLYNRLGVMLYENGNFRQARNYFEKAIELTDSSNINLISNYYVNIASILVKLEDYNGALQIYESVLRSGFFTNEVNHNLGIIHLRLQEPEKALSYLRKTAYTSDRKIVDLYYNYAMAFSMLQEKDSSDFYYQQALSENIRWNGQRKNVTHGLLLKFRADELSSAGKYKEAINIYHAAIKQLHTGFEKEDERSNPEEFTQAYSFINLFQTLTAKAEAFSGLHASSHEANDLISSLDTYEAAFRLAHHIERSYDSDEARLFLNQIKHSAHSRPIDVSIRLYELTNERKYLESAYLFDQRNKASVLSLNMEENEFRINARYPLLQREREIRSFLTRSSLKAANTTDSALLATLNREIRDAEIELGRIQGEVSGLPEFQGRLLSEKIPSPRDIQKKLDNKTVLVSWHLSEKDLLALVIRGDKFTYRLIPVDSSFIPLLDSFRSTLQVMDPLKRYEGTQLAKRLHQLLLTPLLRDLRNMERMIIIPDDELSYIPFEALQDEEDKYFIEKFSIQYQFSTHFIKEPKRKAGQQGILAVAPFALRGFNDTLRKGLTILPASLEEVRELDGTILIDSIGTKRNFLASANKYRTLHLATHAFVDHIRPGLSFIAFYPSGDDYKLYAREIYDLRLDSTDLVILSACETGMGKLIKGEGLMSLSRAFAFAGCPNIIMSLWMAEDKTTSYLARRLHYYLDKDLTRDEALHQAKKDLLAEGNLDPRFKTPNYWAHLLYIGEYEKKKAADTWLWVVAAFILSGMAYFLVKKFK